MGPSHTIYSQLNHTAPDSPPRLSAETEESVNAPRSEGETRELLQ